MKINVLCSITMTTVGQLLTWLHDLFLITPGKQCSSVNPKNITRLQLCKAPNFIIVWGLFTLVKLNPDNIFYRFFPLLWYWGCEEKSTVWVWNYGEHSAHFTRTSTHCGRVCASISPGIRAENTTYSPVNFSSNVKNLGSKRCQNNNGE